jgi:hypothetical protein
MALFHPWTFRALAPNWSLRLAVVMAFVFGALCCQGLAAEPNYNGHYELIDAKNSRSFSLDVKQTGSRAQVSFSAAMADGSGAAPDGTGKGHVEDGVLSFKFKDSFKNEGTCTLEGKTNVYHLNIIVTKVADPGPFHFYGNLPLKKTSDKL